MSKSSFSVLILVVFLASCRVPESAHRQPNATRPNRLESAGHKLSAKEGGLFRVDVSYVQNRGDSPIGAKYAITQANAWFGVSNGAPARSGLLVQFLTHLETQTTYQGRATDVPFSVLLILKSKATRPSELAAITEQSAVIPHAILKGGILEAPVSIEPREAIETFRITRIDDSSGSFEGTVRFKWKHKIGSLVGGGAFRGRLQMAEAEKNRFLENPGHLNSAREGGQFSLTTSRTEPLFRPSVGLAERVAATYTIKEVFVRPPRAKGRQLEPGGIQFFFLSYSANCATLDTDCKDERCRYRLRMTFRPNVASVASLKTDVNLHSEIRSVLQKGGVIEPFWHGYSPLPLKSLVFSKIDAGGTIVGEVQFGERYIQGGGKFTAKICPPVLSSDEDD